MKNLDDLLKLKRYENPPSGYMNDFVSEFHRRQRALQIQKTRPEHTWVGFKQWFADLGMSRWIYGGGLAYACLVLWLLVSPEQTNKNEANFAPVNYTTPSAKPLIVSPLDIQQNPENTVLPGADTTVVPSQGKPF